MEGFAYEFSGHNFLGGSFGHNAPLTHSYDSIGVTRGMDHIVDHHDHRSLGTVKISDEVQDGQLVRGVEVSSWLIKQGNWCFLRQRHSEENALALAARKVCGGGIEKLAHPSASGCTLNRFMISGPHRC